MGSGRSLDGTLDALSHEHRRRLLLALREENPQEAADPQGSEETPSSDTELMMYHAHLPKLESDGFIRWNRQEGTIEKGPEWDEIEPFLKLLGESEHDLLADCA
jgi:hypothetical protein